MDREGPGAGTRQDDPLTELDEERVPGTEEEPVEDREEELEGEPEHEETPEERLTRIEKDNQRLSQSNRELLRMKSKTEGLRRRLRELEQARYDEYQQRGVPQEERERVARLRAAAAELAASDDPRDQLLAEALQGIRQLDRGVMELAERSRFRIPARYQKAVERLMATGDFANPRGALRVIVQAEKARRGSEESGEQQGEERERPRPRRRPEPPARRPVHTVTRPVPASERIVSGQIRTITQSQYTRALAGPKRSEILKAFGERKLHVVPD